MDLANYPAAHQSIWQAILAIWSEEVTSSVKYVPSIVLTSDGSSIRGVLFDEKFVNINEALVYASEVTNPASKSQKRRSEFVDLEEEVPEGSDKRKSKRRSKKAKVIMIWCCFSTCDVVFYSGYHQSVTYYVPDYLCY